MDFQGVDLRSVLRTFAEISGLNMVIDPDVQGTVDIVLTDVPWDQALEVILRGNALDYTVDGTIVRIARIETLRREQDARTQLAQSSANAGALAVRTYTLSYAKADQAAPLVKSSVLSPRGNVQIDARTNTLIITDLPARLDTVQQLLGTIDRAEPQVEIEARIITTTRDYARALGLQWGFNGRVDSTIGNTTGLTFPNNGSLGGRLGQQGPIGTDPRAQPLDRAGTAVDLPLVSDFPPTSAIGLALGSINGALNLDVALSALERTGKGRILSTPRVTTQNNVDAEITQGVQIPIQVEANNTVTTTYKDAALTLKVTPQITAANTVIMQITLENSSPGAQTPDGGLSIDTQRAITRVQVNDGMTTVIGGIFVSREQTTNSRTPLLYRIPFLGWLFKNDSQTDTQPRTADLHHAAHSKGLRVMKPLHFARLGLVALAVASASCGSVREGTGTSFLIVEGMDFAPGRRPDAVRGDPPLGRRYARRELRRPRPGDLPARAQGSRLVDGAEHADAEPVHHHRPLSRAVLPRRRPEHPGG